MQDKNEYIVGVQHLIGIIISSGHRTVATFFNGGGSHSTHGGGATAVHLSLSHRFGVAAVGVIHYKAEAEAIRNRVAHKSVAGKGAIRWVHKIAGGVTTTDGKTHCVGSALGVALNGGCGNLHGGIHRHVATTGGGTGAIAIRHASQANGDICRRRNNQVIGIGIDTVDALRA